MPRLGPATLLAAFVALGATAHASTVAIHGSTTVSNAVLTPHKADIEQASGETLDIVANGSGRGHGGPGRGQNRHVDDLRPARGGGGGNQRQDTRRP